MRSCPPVLRVPPRRRSLPRCSPNPLHGCEAVRSGRGRGGAAQSGLAGACVASRGALASVPCTGGGALGLWQKVGKHAQQVARRAGSARDDCPCAAGCDCAWLQSCSAQATRRRSLRALQGRGGPRPSKLLPAAAPVPCAGEHAGPGARAGPARADRGGTRLVPRPFRESPSGGAQRRPTLPRSP